MGTKDIAEALSRIVGRPVSRSQVSHARGYFGPCNDNELIKKFVNYYETNKKYPRKSDSKKAGKPAYCYFEVQNRQRSREFAVPFEDAWKSIRAIFKPLEFPRYDEVEGIKISFVR